jgi:hypothetical protein
LKSGNNQQTVGSINPQRENAGLPLRNRSEMSVPSKIAGSRFYRQNNVAGIQPDIGWMLQHGLQDDQF